MRFSDIKLQWKLQLVAALVFVPILGGGIGYFFNQAYWLEVNTALGGLMNFVDAKQQGVIRFIGQNEKFATQMASLATEIDPVLLRNHFAKVVETDTFSQANHPFKDEIAAGKRKIPTWRAYHAIDLIRDGKIIVSSDPTREGRDWPPQPDSAIDPKIGYSDVWMDGDTPVLSFSAEGGGGTVYIHTDARMLTLIVSGEIGNMEGGMGAFYLAGVGKTFDFYIVNKDNFLITESPRHPGALLKIKGSTFPWRLTQKDSTLNQVCSTAGKYVTNARCTTGCQEAMGFYESQEGKLLLGASMPFYDSGWTIVVEQEASELLGPLFNLGYLLFGLSILLFSIALFIFGRVVHRHVVKPLTSLNAAISEMSRNESECNLTKRYDTGNKEEMGAISRAFDGLLDTFQSIVRDINQNTAQLACTISDAEESSTQINAGSQAQRDAAISVAAAVEEVSVSTTQIADLAREARDLAVRDLQLSTDGVSIAEETAKDMAHVATLVEESSHAVTILNERSSHIGGIVGVIKEIADQTNLLALNAAIEAARAGEQGRGFAVVADEVRKLAERTAKATTEIQELIDTMRTEVDHTALSMTTTRTGMMKCLDLVYRVREALQEIGSKTQEMSHMVTDIAAATHEQDGAIQNIAQNVENISSMSESNSAAAQHALDLATSLRTLGEKLQQGFSRFKL